MTITFDVKRPRQEVELPACPKCGAHLGNYGDPACDYIPEGDTVPCGGYGPTLDPVQEGLNVANYSASLILYGVLGYGRDEVDPYGGTLDPTDVLRRLAVGEHKVPGLVQPPSADRGVYIDEHGVGPGCLIISAGYDAERIQRYIDRLRALATKAQEEGASLVYG